MPIFRNRRSSTSKRLLIILPSLNAGGTEHVRFKVASELVHFYKWEVTFLTLLSPRGQLYESVSRNFHTVSLDSPRISLALIPLYCFLFAKRSYYSAVLVGLWPLTFIVPFLHLATFSKSRLVVSEHADLVSEYASNSLINYWLLRLSVICSYRIASERLSVSKGVCITMSQLSLIPLCKFKTIYNPLPAARVFTVDQLNVCRLLWPNNSFRVLTVAGLRPQKNLHRLIEAFAHPSVQHCSLVIVGDGPEKRSLLQLVNSLNLVDRVKLVGYVPDPSCFYQAADLFVLFSLYEGFPNVLLEALSAGLTTIATDCPWGASEIIVDSSVGMLIPNDDSLSLLSNIYNYSKSIRSYPASPISLGRFSLPNIISAYNKALTGCS